MNNYGELKCSGNENGIEYKVFLDNNFKYTIVVKNGDVENVKHHQGTIAIFGVDSIDVGVVNAILDDMINEFKK